MKIRPLGAVLMLSDRRTDRTKVTVSFSVNTTAPDSSTFCLHGVVLCFVWNSEQMAIISLYKWFLHLRYNIYCAVRAESLNIIQVNISLQRVYRVTSKPFGSDSKKIKRGWVKLWYG